jgi:hypothetical protein
MLDTTVSRELIRLSLGDNRYLLLAPRWAEFPAPVQFLLLLLAWLLPLALIVWLYRYEMRLTEARHARLLLFLRTLVILAPIVLVTLRPILGHVSHEELPGRVLVGLDVSESMDVRDPQREPVEKLRLARTLHLNEGLVSGTQLDEWIAALAAKKPIVWVKPDEFPEDAERRRKEEKTRTKQYDTLRERVDTLTRSQAAEKLLSNDGLRLLAKLRSKHEVELFTFSRDTQSVPLDQLDKLFTRDKPPAIKEQPEKKDPNAGNKKDKKDQEEKDGTPTTARTAATDLALLQKRALERAGEGKGKILGVVVVTDGQHNTGDSPVKKAEELKQHGIPFYPVALGARKPPSDIAVLGVQAPLSGFKGVDVPVKVRFKATGVPAQDLVVKIYRQGEEDKPLAQRIIKHDGKDQEYSPESFQVRLDRVGRERLLATVKPANKDTKEAREDNNQQPVVINVGDDKAKVLLVDGEARWEFHYLWQVLLRDRSMKVDSVVYVQPRLGKLSEEELKRINNPARALPRAEAADKDPLFEYDCVILGDVLPEQLPRPDRERLRRYVADRGGTLVILAGKRANPLGFVGQSPPAPEKEGAKADENTDPLLAMLPIENPQAVATAEPFPVTLTEAGKQADFLKLANVQDLLSMQSRHPLRSRFEDWCQQKGAVPSDQLARAFLLEFTYGWKALPGHYWGVAGKAKKGATTLAYVVRGDASKWTAEERRKAEEENALMVRSSYGFGRVFFVGLDSTWRWRFRIGDLYHHRFWGQTIRWAASDKPLLAGNKYVRFGTPQAVYLGTDVVKVVVRLTEDAGAIPENLLARARLVRQKGKKETTVALVELKRRPLQPRVLDGEVRDLPAGEYFIELDIPEMKEKLQPTVGEDGKPVALRAPFTVTPGESGEMIQLATNWTLLKEMADKNGSGKVYTPENASELVELLAAKAVTKTEVDETRLWQSKWLLILLVCLLTVEWVSRKWIGLP